MRLGMEKLLHLANGQWQAGRRSDAAERTDNRVRGSRQAAPAVSPWVTHGDGRAAEALSDPVFVPARPFNQVNFAEV